MAVAPSLADESGKALSEAAFAALLDPLGPFEPKPRLAVGVSGGGDSLALALLAARWAQARGGSILALTVDHGLRPGSAAEARAVGRQLRERGIAQRTLRWQGLKPAGNLQDAARRARLALLTAACRKAGILHLLLAQQCEDQAETFLIRLARGSGLDGLAGMAPLVETADLRLLRPLLGQTRADLRATLRAEGLDWVEDPSNRNPRFTRARLRAAEGMLAAEGLGAARLAATAAHLGRARQALEIACRDLLVQACRPDPTGFLFCDRALLLAAPEEIGLRALSRMLAFLGGSAYPPRFERLESLLARLRAPGFKAATLGGCRIMTHTEEDLLLLREARGLETLRLEAGASGRWDGRFAYRIGRQGAKSGPKGRPGWRGALKLGPLGAEGARSLEAALPGASQALGRIPGPAKASLPAFRDEKGILALPALGLWRDAGARRALGPCRLAPERALSSAGFTVV